MKSSVILDKLSGVISELSLNYPEIFRNLEEDNFLPGFVVTNPVSEKDLNSYLESLKNILENYQKNHQDKLVNYTGKIPSELRK
ncbi:hypothetical protein C7S20_07370 [Christiangramia fulva]|uniref:Uncharacterized protein n=1 Tax=Christiangramia fulva TaxID=2126553 RepID=A0A2R3Z497_9FLAO|nr:hypothetical protein [Christiangramia fulva]AVR45103.1 hypothetical protein C7S20_07370 [Christiangramia fulva]